MSEKNKKEEVIILLYLFFMVGISPLFFRAHYLDIVSAKKGFFQIVSILFLIGILLFGRKNRWRGALSGADICAAVFFLTIVISCVCSPEGGEAFWGTQGRRLGGAFLLLCVGVYFVLSRYYKRGSLLLWIFLIGNCLVWAIVVCNFWGWDLLHMYADLAEDQHLYFIGTMGNNNINSGYSGVVTALMMGLYYMGQERLTRRCFFCAVILGTYVCCCTRSDSWLLAVGGGMFLLLCVAMREGHLLKWCGLGGAFWTGLALMKATESLDRLAGWENMYIQDLRGQGLLYALIDIKILAVLGAALLLLALSRSWKVWQVYGPWILAAAAAIGTAAAIVSIFPLEDAFGTSRGYIWKRTVWNFREYTFLQKLWGYGPNCFLQSMEEAYGTQMRELYGAPFIDAHNECLQFLAVTGILGALSYMGLQVTLLIACLRGRGRKPVLLLGCVGIFAYLLQGLVNNPQVFTTPLYFIFLGIVADLCREGIAGDA